MRHFLLCAFSLSLLLFSACSSSEEERAASDSERAEDRAPEPSLAAPQVVSPNSEAEPQPDRRFPAAAGQRNVPLRVGQWVRYEMQVPGAPPSDVYYRVTEQVGEEFWVEVERGSAGHQNIMAIRVRPGDDREAETRPVPSAVRSYNTRAGRVQEMPSRMIREYSAMLDPFLAAIFFPWPTGEGETVRTPAGQFEGSIRAERQQEVLGNEVRAIEWFHAAVPITGMVQFQSETNRAHRMRLHSFGESGAISALTPHLPGEDAPGS